MEALLGGSPGTTTVDMRWLGSEVAQQLQRRSEAAGAGAGVGAEAGAGGAADQRQLRRQVEEKVRQVEGFWVLSSVIS